MTRPRTFREHMLRTAERVGVAWSALVLVALLLWLLPLSTRAA